MKISKNIVALVLGISMFVELGTPVFAAGRTLTVQEAIEHGLANSHILEKVETEIGLAEVSKRRGAYAARKLKRGERDLKKAMEGISGLVGQEELPAEIQEQVQGALSKIDEGEENLFKAIKEATKKVRNNLDFQSLDLLSLDSSAELVELMSSVLHDVSTDSYNYYENNIALLIKNSYCEALKHEKIWERKSEHRDRALGQLEEVKTLFQEGRATERDLNLAGAFYRQMAMEVEQALMESRNAKLELMKNANLDMGEEIQLVDSMAFEREDFDLEDGIVQGLLSRFEVRKALGEVLVKATNFEEIKKSYTSNTFQYQEAKYILERARADYRQTKREVR